MISNAYTFELFKLKKKIRGVHDMLLIILSWNLRMYIIFNYKQEHASTMFKKDLFMIEDALIYYSENSDINYPWNIEWKYKNTFQK